jgi:hypothetical protein
MGPEGGPPILKPDRKLKQKTGYEHEVSQLAGLHRCSQKPGNQETSSQRWNAAVKRFAKVHKKGFCAWSSGLALRYS